MEHLPPVGRADVLMKRDLDALKQRIDLRYEALEHNLVAGFRSELQTALTAQVRRIAITFAVTAGAASGVAFAAGRLA